MEFLGDRAEFKRGRGPDKRPRKRRSTQVGMAGGSLAGGAAAGYGVSALGRDIGDRREVGRAVRQARKEYRQVKGKYPSRTKTRELRQGLRDAQKRYRSTNSAWKNADDVFNYEIVKPNRKWRLPGPPKIVSNAASKVLKPFGKVGDIVDGFTRPPRIVSRGPIKGGRIGNTAGRLLSRPGGKAAAIGAAAGGLAYGTYRGLRALDGR